MPDLEIQIEKANWRDLRSFLAIERRCFGRDAWPWIDVLSALTFAGTIRLKAVKDEDTVGFVIGERRSGDSLGWIASICVEPHYQRMGIGRKLLTACEKQLSTERIRLSLRRSNEAAYSLYQALGYRPITQWVEYYRDGEDAVVMEKRIENRMVHC